MFQALVAKTRPKCNDETPIDTTCSFFIRSPKALLQLYKYSWLYLIRNFHLVHFPTTLLQLYEYSHTFLTHYAMALLHLYDFIINISLQYAILPLMSCIWRLSLHQLYRLLFKNEGPFSWFWKTT